MIANLTEPCPKNISRHGWSGHSGLKEPSGSQAPAFRRGVRDLLRKHIGKGGLSGTAHPSREEENWGDN